MAEDGRIPGAYHPTTGLYYVMALEKCNIYTKSSAWWEPGRSFYGGTAREIPGEPGQKFLRAVDAQTGAIARDVAQEGPADTGGGVLSTAGALVFCGYDSGAFAAAEAGTGELLWQASRILKRERIALGLSLADMQERMGMSRSPISRLGNDETANPMIETLSRYAERGASNRRVVSVQVPGTYLRAAVGTGRPNAAFGYSSSTSSSSSIWMRGLSR